MLLFTAGRKSVSEVDPLSFIFYFFIAVMGGWVGIEYCNTTALPPGGARQVQCLLSVQMRHWVKGDVHICVPVKQNNSIMLMFYQ